MPIKALMAKEFDRIKSDRKALFIMIAMPVFIMAIFGFSSGGEIVVEFNAVIITEDAAPYPNNSTMYEMDFINAVNDSSNIHLISIPSLGFYKGVFNASQYGMEHGLSEKEVDEYVQELVSKVLRGNKGVDAVFILPRNFSDCFESRKDTIYYVYYDNSNIRLMQGIEYALTLLAFQFRLQSGRWDGMILAIPYPEYDVPSWYPTLFNLAAPQMLPIIILGSSMLLSSLSVVTEAALPRILLTPAPKHEVIIAKVVTYFLLVLIQGALIFTLSLAFGLYTRGDLVLILGSIYEVGFVGVCIGIFISSISENEQQANQFFTGMVILMVLFSGEVIPLENLDPVFYQIAETLPVLHSSKIFNELIVAGQAATVIDHYIALLLISLGYILASIVAMWLRKMEV